MGRLITELEQEASIAVGLVRLPSPHRMNGLSPGQAGGRQRPQGLRFLPPLLVHRDPV